MQTQDSQDTYTHNIQHAILVEYILVVIFILQVGLCQKLCEQHLL